MGFGGVLQVQRLALVDQGADPVDLAAAPDLVGDAGDDLVAPVVGKHLGHDRRAAWRQLVDGADVEVGEVSHRQRSRYWRGAHHQQVGLQRRPGAVGGRQLAPQLQPLRHAEAVLLVDDRQPQPGEVHIVLDHRLGADHQPGFARGDAFDHLAPATAFAAAGQPGDAHAQRLQPLHQLAEMLLGQQLGGCHQRALPARVDRHGGSERGDHGLARAHIALQQAVHRHRAFAGSAGVGRAHQVAGDLLGDAALGGGELERQRGQQPLVQAAGFCAQQRRTQPGPLALGRQLRQLLGQQLLELQPLPGRSAAVLQRAHRRAGWRVVQAVQRFAQAGQPRRHGARRQHLVKCSAPQRRGHRLAQISLRQLGIGGVDGRQRSGQWAVLVDRLELRVDHLAAEEAGVGLAANPHPRAHGQCLLVAGVEVQKTQQQVVAVVLDAHQQLAAAAQLDAAFADDAFDLHRLAVGRIGDGADAGLVLVAQRQVQRQVDVAAKPKLFHGPLRAGFLAGLGPCCRTGFARRVGHGSRFCRAAARGCERALARCR